MISPERRYRHVLLDFDGVVCDSLQTAMDQFNAIRGAHFPQLPEVKRRGDMTIVYGGSLRTCLHQWLTEEEAKEFFDLHSARMASQASGLRTFPAISLVLNYLDYVGYSLVTSAYSKAVDSILSCDRAVTRTGLYRIAGRELRQPKSQKIRDILDSLGLDVSDAVYVGDLESDVLYCRDVPIDIVAVGYGYHPTWHLARCDPTYLVGSPEELYELLPDLCIPGE